VHGDDVADEDATACGNPYDSPAAMKLPFERTAGLQVAIINQDMSTGQEIERCGYAADPENAKALWKKSERWWARASRREAARLP